MDWINTPLLLFIFGVFFWEIRNIKNNHLKSIYSRLRQVEIQLAEIKTILERERD